MAASVKILIEKAIIASKNSCFGDPQSIFVLQMESKLLDTISCSPYHELEIDYIRSGRA